MVRAEQEWTRRGWLWDAGCIALVLALGAALYVRALAVPWYLDDWDNIVRNPVSRSIGLALARLGAPRGIAFLSFALNDALLGPNPAGFHAVNVGIHLAACVIVYALLRRLVPRSLGIPRHPGPLPEGEGDSVRGEGERRDSSRLLAVAGAAIFAAHPLQTQAVTYAVQRMASLSALFFLLSFLLFLHARDRVDGGARFLSARHLAEYASSLLFAALAVLTKQNTVVFPVVFLVADRFFGARERGGWRRRLAYLAPFFAVAAGLGLKDLVPQLVIGSGVRLARPFDWFLIGYAGPGEPLLENTPLRYFVTELSVLWAYLRLLVLPWGQAIDHGYPLVAAYFTARNVAAALGVVALSATAFLARRRLPLLSFGIAFFLLGLSVESTVFPLDTMEEHRLYLPMLGFVLALLEAVRRLPRRSLQALAAAAALVPLSVLTWERNGLWTDPVAFFQDGVESHPANPRLWVLYSNVLDDSGQRGQARAALEKALELNPVFPVAMVDLGSIYVNDGRLADAEALYRKALSLVYGFPAAHRKLGRLMAREHRVAEALAEFEVATLLEPSDVESLFFAALMANQLGDRERAVRLADRLATLDPLHAASVYTAIGAGR